MVLDEQKAILDSVKMLALVDLTYAKARFSIAYNMSPPDLSPDASLQLREARHPLLLQLASRQKGCSVAELTDEVVPIDVRLGDDFDLLLVTGPNTGGKTVTLKTVGLLAAMNQFGMEIPAREDSVLPVFDNILADIGDEQSIEQSLSTFSAHIVNISRIISGSTASSLVLFDELGAGTDPEEGVAIAMGLLDHFIRAGCLCMATTHHGILKNYGYSRPGVENAA